VGPILVPARQEGAQTGTPLRIFCQLFLGGDTKFPLRPQKYGPNSQNLLQRPGRSSGRGSDFRSPTTPVRGTKPSPDDRAETTPPKHCWSKVFWASQFFIGRGPSILTRRGKSYGVRGFLGGGIQLPRREGGLGSRLDVGFALAPARLLAFPCCG